MIGRCTMKTPSLLVLLVCSTLVAEPQVGAQEKAEAAPSLYVKKATWPETMTASGRSEFDPIDTNDTEEGRARNRRIEIVVYP